MPLTWARLDVNIHSNDKIVALLDRKDGAKAFTLYVTAMGWSVGQGTDGLIPGHILRVLVPWPAKPLALALVEERLWEYAEGGHRIVNFHDRQELALVAEQKAAARRVASLKANCQRHHGADCGCWREAS